jgi:FtsZ-interacting cell division protein ZipA
MMSELRWTLLILGVLFIAVLAWWERRRPRQASGALERRAPRESLPEAPPRAVRDPPLTLPEVHPRTPLATAELPVLEVTEAIARAPMGPPAYGRDEGSHSAQAQETAGAQETFETRESAQALEARQSDEDDTEEVALLDPAEIDLAECAEIDAAELEPARTGPPDTAEPVSARGNGEAAAAAAPIGADSTAVPSNGRPREALPELPPAAPLVVEWPSEEERRVLALRLVAPQAERFAGRSLRQALAAEGFLLGQFAIFHKPDDERRAVLSAASLTRPGTFDMDTMDSQHYGGLSLFAVLPGPKSPPQAFEDLVFAARNLNERLHGVLQDEQGAPLTPARIAQLREQLRTGTAS